MNRYARNLAIVLAVLTLGFMGAAHGQRAQEGVNAPSVTWMDAPGSIPIDSTTSAGLKVVKDADTGRLRPARAGELPETAVASPTQIINSPDGGGIAIVGDDLLSESVAVKQADGSITVHEGRDAGGRTHQEEK